jgi:two-component system LytT family response regulator|tara:strand:+ start:301 stop:720 length:420 start_codon:yes stop_codon:yes gene_type:complete
MLKVLIVDDEVLARETIKLLLSSITDIAQVYEAENGNQALTFANQYQPDIVVLDIEMPGMSGIELARLLPKDCVVIFATAYNQYAVDAFELNSVDYLLKPFDDDRFYVAFERAKVRLTEGGSQNYEGLNETIKPALSGR